MEAGVNSFVRCAMCERSWRCCEPAFVDCDPAGRIFAGSASVIAKSCLFLSGHGALFHGSDGQVGDRNGILGLRCIDEDTSALKTLCWQLYNPTDLLSAWSFALL